VDEVHLDGEVLVVDAMLAGGVEVELLEREGRVPHGRRPVHHDLDGCSQIFEGDVMLRCDLHLHKAASFDRNCRVENDGRLRLPDGTQRVFGGYAVPVCRPFRRAVIEVRDRDAAAGRFAPVQISSMGTGSERGWGLEEPQNQRSNQRSIHNERR
jgi:hypothetical protein